MPLIIGVFCLKCVEFLGVHDPASGRILSNGDAGMEHFVVDQELDKPPRNPWLVQARIDADLAIRLLNVGKHYFPAGFFRSALAPNNTVIQKGSFFEAGAIQLIENGS